MSNEHPQSWRLLAVDDDPGVLDATAFVFDDFSFQGKPVELRTASSAKEALALVEEGYEPAVALIDIVMEQENAGLELVKDLRSRDALLTRLVIRTGQPGTFPEEEVFIDYDIHAYLDKADLSALRLKTAATSGFRAYADLVELRKYGRHMEELVNEKTEELREINRTLEERVENETVKNLEQQQLLIQQTKMAEIGELFGMLTHQWRQPLTVLSLIAQQVADDIRFKEYSEEGIIGEMDRIEHQIQFMSDTVEHFRNFLKPVKQATLFNVADAVAESLSYLEGLGGKQGIRIDFRRNAGEEPLASGYPNEFKQVILNLVKNGFDALEKRPEGKRLEVAVNVEGHQAVVTVEDNGGGIDEGMLPHLFKIFQTSKGDQGTGLGLYMAKVIVEEKMDGTIEAANTGEGARFTLRLPLAGGTNKERP